jgi:hypothetical protein
VQATRLIAADARVDATTLQRVLAPTEKLVTGIDPLQRATFDASSYRIEALNAAQDLGALADRVANWRPGSGPGLSLCLYGPPGTGQSEYIKFLAHRMGRHVNSAWARASADWTPRWRKARRAV